jgi:hypothetical protein
MNVPGTPRTPYCNPTEWQKTPGTKLLDLHLGSRPPALNLRSSKGPGYRIVSEAISSHDMIDIDIDWHESKNEWGRNRRNMEELVVLILLPSYQPADATYVQNDCKRFCVSLFLCCWRGIWLKLHCHSCCLHVCGKPNGVRQIVCVTTPSIPFDSEIRGMMSNASLCLTWVFMTVPQCPFWLTDPIVYSAT